MIHSPAWRRTESSRIATSAAAISHKKMIHKTLLKQDVCHSQTSPAIHSASDQRLAGWGRERVGEGTTMRGIDLLVLCCSYRAMKTVGVGRVAVQVTYDNQRHRHIWLPPSFFHMQAYWKIYFSSPGILPFSTKKFHTPSRNPKYFKYSQFRGRTS